MINKKIAKNVTKHLFFNFIAVAIVAIIVAGIFGIFYLAKIHWLFYGLIPIFMWIIIYIFAILSSDAEVSDSERRNLNQRGKK